MSPIRCPHCDTPLPTQDTAEGRCSKCGKPIAGEALVDVTAIQEPDDIPTLKPSVEPPFERLPQREAPRRTSSGPHCPKCGSDYLSSGPWPWYLGTVGAMLCRAMICDDCGHEFDAKKPHANLASRKRNLAIAINGIGLLGILGIIGALVLWIWWFMKHM